MVQLSMFYCFKAGPNRPFAILFIPMDTLANQSDGLRIRMLGFNSSSKKSPQKIGIQTRSNWAKNPNQSKLRKKVRKKWKIVALLISIMVWKNCRPKTTDKTVAATEGSLGNDTEEDEEEELLEYIGK